MLCSLISPAALHQRRWKEEKMGTSDVTAPSWLAQRCRLDETGISLNWSLIKLDHKDSHTGNSQHWFRAWLLQSQLNSSLNQKVSSFSQVWSKTIISIIHSYWQEVALHKDKIRQTQTQLFAVLWKCCWRLSGRTQWPLFRGKIALLSWRKSTLHGRSLHGREEKTPTTSS